MATDSRQAEAVRLVAQGRDHLARGEVDEAIRCYRRSIDLHPTAEGHTCLGWAVSFQGDLKGGIAHCVSAINLDPDFGNPYNDIGVYMIQLGRHADAVPFLEKAMRAGRYESRHHPHINMARVFEKQGRWYEALDELARALVIKPGDSTSLCLRARILGLLN